MAPSGPETGDDRGRPKLLGITKRSSKYLRKMLIQGARTAMPTLRQSETQLGRWLRGLLARAHANTAAVALAAKTARIIWALLRHAADASIRRLLSRPDPSLADAVCNGLSLPASGERKMA